MKFGSNRNKKAIGITHFMAVIGLFISQAVYAQHTYLPTGSFSSQILSRLEIKSGELANGSFHTASNSFQRQKIAHYVDSFPVSRIGLSKADYFNLSYLIQDNFVVWDLIAMQKRRGKPSPTPRKYSQK